MTILNAQAFLTNQLMNMQAEMDDLAEPKSNGGDDKVVDINTLIGGKSNKKVDAALVTGSFEFRPTTQTRQRMTIEEVNKAMDELETLLGTLGVEISYDKVKVVELSA